MSTLLLDLAVVVALFTPFEAYQVQNNGRDELVALTPVVREYHLGTIVDTDRRGLLTFTNARWSDERPWGIAQFELTHPGKLPATGWLVICLDADGLIEAMSWTTVPPPQAAHHGAETGQASDLATTVVGLAQGATELNPLVDAAMPAMAAIKLTGPSLLRTYATMPTCVSGTDAMQDTGFGAAAWNIGVIAGIGPLAILPAVGAYLLSKKSHAGFWRCVPDDIYPHS